MARIRRDLAVEGGGTATFRFNAPQSYFGLLWGSVDTYNALSFYDASGDLIATVGGAGAGADGNQGAAGTDYVNVFSDGRARTHCPKCSRRR
jgi:hypothetical protein